MRTAVVVACILAAACSRSREAGPASQRDRDAAMPGGDAAAARPNPFETFATTAPTVGSPAPEIALPTASGARFELAAARARGPVVLVFGSFTCPPFRMKQPRFEELARRWRGMAEVYLVFSEEAHAKADGSPRLNAFADRVQAMDADRDGTVAVGEYQGPRYMFDAFDLDHDGAVRSHEFLAARRLDQFASIEEPTTEAARLALAQRFRAEIPGELPIAIDALDNAVSARYGGLPNMAYVIGADGNVAFKIPWAAVADVEGALAKLLGAPPPASPPPPDLAILAPALAAARAAGRGVVVQFTATGCRACEALETGALQDPAVVAALAAREHTRLNIERDDTWRLFESLGLSATPAFVAIARDGTIGARLEGPADVPTLLAFLRR